MNMIERVALSILNSDRMAAGLTPVESRSGIPGSDGYVRNATAAIQAMRDPTPEMIDRFVSRALCVSVSGEGGWSKYALDQWQAMIDAIIPRDNTGNPCDKAE